MEKFKSKLLKKQIKTSLSSGEIVETIEKNTFITEDSYVAPLEEDSRKIFRGYFSDNNFFLSENIDKYGKNGENSNIVVYGTIIEGEKENIIELTINTFQLNMSFFNILLKRIKAKRIFDKIETMLLRKELYNLKEENNGF